MTTPPTPMTPEQRAERIISITRNHGDCIATLCDIKWLLDQLAAETQRADTAERLEVQWHDITESHVAQIWQLQAERGQLAGEVEAKKHALDNWKTAAAEYYQEVQRLERENTALWGKLAEANTRPLESYLNDSSR